MTAAVRELESTPTTFAIGAGRSLFEAWAANGSRTSRWYYHRKAGGRVTDSASYASRRSCRRAILTRIARGDA